MRPKVTTFSGIAAQVEAGVAKFRAALPETLLAAGTIVQLDAMSRLGHYQDGWAPLKPATQAERVRKGYSADEPLLRSGELRQAIHVRVLGDAAVAIGVDGDMGAIATAQEFGSAVHNVPPRPFIGPAGRDSLPAATKLIGDALKIALES